MIATIPGAGAGDENVVLGLDQHLQHIGDLLGNGAVGDELFDGHGGLGEFTDGQRGTAQSDGRQHHVDTGAVGQTGVTNGVCLVDFTAGQTYDSLNHVLQTALAFKLLIRIIEPRFFTNGSQPTAFRQNVMKFINTKIILL